MRKDRLQNYRVKRGYTQETFAAELGVEKKQVSRWETGSTIPGSDRLAEMAKILDVSTDYLLGLSDDPTPNMRVDNLSEDEKAILKALRRGDDKEAIKIIASR